MLSGWRLSHLLHSKCLSRCRAKILIPFTATSPSSRPELFVHVQARAVVYLVWWFPFLCTCEYAKEAKNDHTGLALLLFPAPRTVCLLNYNLPSRIQLMWVPPSHTISSLFMETARDSGCPKLGCVARPQRTGQVDLGNVFQDFAQTTLQWLRLLPFPQRADVPSSKLHSQDSFLAPGSFFVHFIPFIQVPHPIFLTFNLTDASNTSGMSCLQLQASQLFRKYLYLKSNVYPSSSHWMNESCWVPGTWESWSGLGT